jgi:membrane-associated phospholipid phosphatase
MQGKNLFDPFKTARVISTLLVPPIPMLFVFILLAIQVEDICLSKIIVISTTLLFGVMLPIFLFIYLLKKKKVVNKDADKKEERTLPFSIALLFYICGFFVLRIFDINLFIQSFWFGYITNMFLLIMINKFWKISIHAVGISGPATIVVCLLSESQHLFVNSIAFFIITILFLVVVIVGWARIKLKCHSVLQVIAGSILGISSTLVHIYLIKNYF